jgi:nicotinate-nucleotide pyrophosphorylase (carboxylating)
MIALSAAEVQEAVHRALAEDVGSGDVTTLACIPPESQSEAVMVAREPMTLAGLELAKAAFTSLSPNLTTRRQAFDGERLTAGQTVLEISGPTRAILTAERVSLNFVQRLSGVATQTARYVEAIEGTKAKILDTRKTTPGLRRFEKYAVACGGGENHRVGLFDLILIKDNHLAALAGEAPHAIGAAVSRGRALYPDLKVEVEADNLEQVRQAVEAQADIILLDNMSLADLRAAVDIIAGRAKTEASGGVTLATIRAIAETGVDFISVGALTHSAQAVDLALDFVRCESIG